MTTRDPRQQPSPPVKKAITAKLAEQLKRSPTAQLIGEQLYRIALPWKRRATVGYYVTFFWMVLGLPLVALIGFGEGFVSFTFFMVGAVWLAFGFATFAVRYMAARRYQKVTGREWKPPLQ